MPLSGRGFFLSTKNVVSVGARFCGSEGGLFGLWCFFPLAVCFPFFSRVSFPIMIPSICPFCGGCPCPPIVPEFPGVSGSPLSVFDVAHQVADTEEPPRARMPYIVFFAPPPGHRTVVPLPCTFFVWIQPLFLSYSRYFFPHLGVVFFLTFIGPVKADVPPLRTMSHLSSANGAQALPVFFLPALVSVRLDSV